MERERLDRLVKEPDLVGRDDLADLQALTERFPWFAGAQVLRSVGEHRRGDVLSEETLRSSVAHIPSRARLFDLVHTEPPATTAPLVIVPKEDPMTLTSGTTPEEPAVGVPLHPSAPAIPMTEPRAGQPEVEEEPPPAEEVPTAPDRGSDPLDRQILEAAMASAYDLTGLLEGTTSTPTHLAVPKAAGEAPSDRQERRPIRTSDRLSFTDWLDGTSGPSAYGPVSAVAIPEVSSDDIASHLGDREPALAGSKDSTGDTTGRKAGETMDLIDRFIHQQSPAAVPRTEFYTPQQAAKRSLDDTAGLVTETLARVYVKQGNLPKAIDAYHRLALKYPEKSAYFAALVKELEIQQHK